MSWIRYETFEEKGSGNKYDYLQEVGRVLRDYRFAGNTELLVDLANYCLLEFTNCLKTEIVVTANLREWMHIFSMRCSKAAHPQMRELMVPLQKEMQTLLPELFS